MQLGCFCSLVDDVINYLFGEVIIDDFEFIGCCEISFDLFG